MGGGRSVEENVELLLWKRRRLACVIEWMGGWKSAGRDAYSGHSLPATYSKMLDCIGSRNRREGKPGEKDVCYWMDWRV